jgi:hypothetical protein
MQRECLDKHGATHFSYVGPQFPSSSKIGVSKRTVAVLRVQTVQDLVVIKLI